MMLVAGLHLVSRCCFRGVSAAVFTTIFTVVLTYIISTAAMSTTRCCSLALSPPPHHVCDRLRTLGLWAPCRPVWSRDADPALRFVRRRGRRAGRRAKRKQTLSADRTCPQPSSPAPSDHVSSSAVLGCLQLNHRRPPEMCGLRTRPQTDVDPQRFLPLRTAIGGGGVIVSSPAGRYLADLVSDVNKFGTLTRHTS